MYRKVSSLPPLAVITSYGDPSAYSGLTRLAVSAAYKAINLYQKDKYPNSDRTDAVHVVVRIYDDYVLDVTEPMATIHSATLREGAKYRAYKWVGADLLQTLLNSKDVYQRIVAEEVIRDAYYAAMKFHQTRYDEFQLVGIGAIRLIQGVVESLIKRWIPAPIEGWISGKIKDLLSFQVFGFGKWRTVCSAGSLAVLIAAYKSLKQKEDKLTAWGYTMPPRPLGDIGEHGQWVESCAPADFENSNTFQEVPLTE